MDARETTNGYQTKPKKQLRVAFDDNIPDEGPELFMLRIKGSKCFFMTCYGTKVRGIYYHWRGDASEPHYTQTDQCPGCKAAQPVKWKGYLHCYCSEMRQEVFLELTRAAALSLQAQIGKANSYRGQCFEVKRTGADNGRLYIAMKSPYKALEQLPAEKDPRASLLALYGFPPDEIAAMLSPENDPEARSEFS